ncbi:GGDEF domain-containing protein [Arenimonas sp.]|uniref:GGDEF domain-containing protein n=1 Tax=Arenimonas sp. TaxID=1872635 RepID=UPI0035AF1AA1
MEWSFDIRSGLLVGAFLTLLIGVVLAFVARAMPLPFRPAMNWWVAATLLQPAGFVLLSQRDQLPAWVTIVVANTCIAGAFAAYAIALRRFHRLKVPWGLLAGLLGLAVAVSAWFGLVQPDLTRRLIAISVVLAVMLGYCAWSIYRGPDVRGLVRHVAGGAFLVATVIMAYRALALTWDPGQVIAVFQLTPVQLMTYAIGSVLPVVATVGFLLLCTDRSQHELERAARMDYLTDVYNRRAIEELGTRAIAGARRHGMPLALQVVDIDDFKHINDELGHAAGDLALVRAVERIRACLRAEDLLGRLGGEEFIVLMPNTDGAAAVAAAERIREAFSERPLHLNGQTRRVTLSIGVAVLAPADRLFSQLLQRGDRAMYAAKHAGRDLVMADAMSGWDNAPD